VFRLIPTAKPVADDFASSAALKTPKPYSVNDCRWASCSMFTTLKALKKKQSTFPKLRKLTFFVEMAIPSGAGKHISDREHVDFWMFADFDPIKAIKKVAAV
jgi:hypothetical protein